MLLIGCVKKNYEGIILGNELLRKKFIMNANKNIYKYPY